ncbi:phosphoglucosamine mutase [Emcibacter sp. SYSU 3D8]|uniref:phosphoglucosamine mutase n=1 Tax=Emcibacter sp. SYSU 3D8 TaxID=3133969 RepID=UPI0031FE51B3
MNKRQYFGTDGIRGTANTLPMTADAALRVGMAAGAQFRRGDHRHRVVIAKDTRLSGYMLEAAMTAGFTSVGMDVVLVGPMPTPAAAMLTKSMRADLGVMISASHNLFEDNGIKLFGPDGFKLSDAIEAEIEARLESGRELDVAASRDIGRARRLDDNGHGRYIEVVKSTFPTGRALDGLKVVIDCANGAAYKLAPIVLTELGAEIVPIGVSPNGVNINKGCGSTDTALMQRTVRESGAHLGIALDGDADRVLMADENGNLLDGDQLMGLIAAYWHRTGRLRGGCLVSTVMSNLGLENYLHAQGIGLVRTAVGDRYVVEHMRAHGCNLGGEQSGHIVMTDYTTTGDGLIAALQVMAVILETGKPASETCRVFTPLPQVLKNVTVSGGAPLDDAAVKAAIADGEARLKGTGRVLIRPSGTEPKIRVMAEGEDQALVNAVVDDIAGAISRAAKAS